MLPVLSGVQALGHTKVKLSWDDDEPNNLVTVKKKFTQKELEELDYSAYLVRASPLLHATCNLFQPSLHMCLALQ